MPGLRLFPSDRIRWITSIRRVSPNGCGSIKGISLPVCSAMFPTQFISTPDSVLVYAPENMLGSITAAYTKKVGAGEYYLDTTRMQLPLLAPKGAKFVHQ